MKIKSIEPTPSPYSMKINVTETLPDGQTENYKLGDDLTDAPTYAKQLFEIEGVKDLYRVIDFIALERNPKVPWEGNPTSSKRSDLVKKKAMKFMMLDNRTNQKKKLSAK